MAEPILLKRCATCKQNLPRTAFATSQAKSCNDCRAAVHPGVRFGKWTIVSFSGWVDGASRWLCRCECGYEKVAAESRIRESSCCHGCASSTHGATRGKVRSPEHIVWASMIARCHNPKHKRYADYGGRGIAVCRPWRESFAAFLADMGPRPTGATIDRIDNDGDYGPGNCRWATYTKQNRNRRNNHLIIAFGRAMCIAEWADAIGVSPKSIRTRLSKGHDGESALAVGGLSREQMLSRLEAGANRSSVAESNDGGNLF